MLAMPAPMINAPNANCHAGKRGWFTSHNAKPLDSTAINSDSAVIPRSKPRANGKRNASMPMKCIDHTPTPIAMAPPAIHT